MQIDILSLFPGYFKGPFDVSMIKRAKEKGLVNIGLVDIRDFAYNKHKKVDDRPFGGGPGMVMQPEPVDLAIKSVKKEHSHVVYLTPQGEMLNINRAKMLAEKKHLVLLSGHYEGIDQRVLDRNVDQEFSIGDYVLTNGSLAAIVLIDVVLRYIPGVLGHKEAAYQETFENGLFEGPVYTRPEVYDGLTVPAILKEGHHAMIKKWQFEKGLEKTKEVRPDLYERYKKGDNK